MRVLVSYKTEPDLDKMPDHIWSNLKELPSMLPFIPEQINLYDESALELVRLLIEQTDQPIAAVALKVTEKTRNPEMKNLMALGYSDCFQIPFSCDFSPEQIAEKIKIFIENYQKPDLIVTGHESAIGNNGQMGYFLAEKLNWPCIAGVIDFSLQEDGGLSIISDEEESLLIQKVTGPLVLVVGNIPDIALKIPSLREKLKYKDFKPKMVKVKDTKKNINTVELVKVDKKRECQSLGSIEEAAKVIIHLAEEVVK